MEISTAPKFGKASPISFPKVAVFQVGPCIIFFLIFFCVWGRQMEGGRGGVDVSSGRECCC